MLGRLSHILANSVCDNLCQYFGEKYAIVDLIVGFFLIISEVQSLIHLSRAFSIFFVRHF